MANDENLIPLSKRSKEEARKIRQKGAQASIEKRRRNKSIRELLAVAMTTTLPEGKVKETLRNLGIEDTNLGQAFALQVIIKGVSTGDANALQIVARLLDEHKSKADLAEQQARIARLKADTERQERHSHDVDDRPLVIVGGELLED